MAERLGSSRHIRRKRDGAARPRRCRVAPDGIGPAWWVPGAHLQTAWARLARSRRLVTFEREVLTTPDDDDLVLDHVAGPPEIAARADAARAGRQRPLAAHAGAGGAGGARGMARDRAQFSLVRARRARHRAPAAQPPPRLYHSGETGDLDFVVRTLVAREPATPIYALGFSLGGAVLLKWLGEVGRASAIRAAATISVPYDLAAAARFLERPRGPVLLRALHHAAQIEGAGPAGAVSARDRARRSAIASGARGLSRVRRMPDRAAARLRRRRRLLPPRPAPSPSWRTSRCRPSASAARTTRFSPANRRTARATPRRPTCASRSRPGAGTPASSSGRWPWRPHYWAEERSIEWLRAAALNGRST